MKYIAYAFAVMAGLSAGCTARGYRPPQNFTGYNAIENTEYNTPIDFFVERELAVLRDDTKFVEKHPEQGTLVKLLSSEHSQQVILNRHSVVTAVSYHNVLLRELFAGKKVQRWLLDSIYRNAKPEFVNIRYESLSDEEQNTVDASLDKLCA
ncbi:hypothetical protein HY484_04855, partial [Candidatus Woesearchaeota archaeon]|nr:hypothetical protein [Candidatus Woesearchaeota archaeon]